MTPQVVIDPCTYRFKIDPGLISALSTFAQANKDVHRKAFQSNWLLWLTENDMAVKRETARLRERGYRGDPVDKMYKSARYYFSKRPVTDDGVQTDQHIRSAPPRRRAYRSMGKGLLAAMDAHLAETMEDNDFTPAGSYVDFCRNCQDAISTEIRAMLADGNVDPEYVVSKVKKTYKNRYFVLSRRGAA